MTIYLPAKDEPAAFGPPLDPADAQPAATPTPPAVAAALDRMQSVDDALFVATSLAELAARHGAGLRQAEAAAFDSGGGADGFAARVHGGFAADVGRVMSDAAANGGARPSDQALDLLRRQADTLGRALLGRAALGEDALRRHGQARAALAALDGLAGLAASDPDALDEAETRADAVIRAATPLIGADAAKAMRARESRRLAEAALRGLIAGDPDEALTRLASGQFDARLDESARQRLAGRAEARKAALVADSVRAARDSAHADGRAAAARAFAFARDFRRRIAAGAATLADLADAEAGGVLAPAQAARLRKDIAAADRQRDAGAEALARVSDLLAAGGTLDPSSPDDRAAAAAHFDGVMTPILDDASPADSFDAIRDYAAQTGIAPAPAVRRLVAGLFEGAAEDRLAAAGALTAIAAHDPAAVSHLPDRLKAGAERPIELLRLGVPPARAAAYLDDLDRGVWRPLPDRDPDPGFSAHGVSGPVTAASGEDAQAEDGAEGSREASFETRIPFPPPGDKPMRTEDAFRDLKFDPEGDVERDLLRRDPLEAAVAALVGIAAERETAEKFETGSLHNNDADAFRHALWNYRMTLALGPEWAKRFGDAHEAGPIPGYRVYEVGSPGPDAERVMDLYNNHVGRALALDPKNRAREAVDVVMEALRTGQLQTKPVISPP